MAKQKTTTKTKGKTPDAVKARPRIIHDGIDITIPDFLYAGEMKPLAERPMGYDATRKMEWATITKKEDRVAPPPTPVFVDNRTLPVIVNVRGKTGPEHLANYENMDGFDAGHDLKTYPVSRAVTFEGTTIILCGAKPWAGREKVERKVVGVKSSGRSKVHLIADLLLRPEGCTTAEVLAATGWPAVSMPAQAKLAGLKLRKEKVEKVTRYWGTK